MKMDAVKLIPRKRIRATRPHFQIETDPLEVESKKVKRPATKSVKRELDPDFTTDLTPVKPEIPGSEALPAIIEPVNVKSESNPADPIKLELEIEGDTEPVKIKAEPPYETPLDTVTEVVPGPRNWKVFIERIREMRKLKIAPVDEMYHDRIYDAGGALDPKIVRFQYLVALMLSSQTKDEVTGAAVARLRKKLDPDLTPEAVLATPEAELAQTILPVGFYRRKAQYLHKACQILLDKHDGDVPRTIEEITELPGVGPKMGYLLLQAAWDQVDGIGVDVHVHRLAQMWHWVPASKNPTPEKTRIELEKWLPRELWLEINPLLVGFGQTWCPSRSSPKLCNACHLSDLCPARKK